MVATAETLTESPVDPLGERPPPLSPCSESAFARLCQPLTQLLVLRLHAGQLLLKLENAAFLEVELSLGAGQACRPYLHFTKAADKLRQQVLHTGIGVEDIPEHTRGFGNGSDVRAAILE